MEDVIMKCVPIKGIITPILTPMNADESVNLDELRRQIERLIAGGVHGIFPFGTNGEGYILSMEEKISVLEATIDQVKGRVPVYAGTGCVSTRDTITLSREAERLGADILSIITPSFAVASQQELYDHYCAVAAHVDTPIVLYNIPARTGNKLLPETVCRLAKDVEVIKGAKDSSGDWENLKAYIQLTKDLDFSVLSGNDSLILPDLKEGGVGGIAGCSNVYPKVLSSMETVRVGQLPDGDEVRMDRFAHEADAVIVVGRIKAHTAFRGTYESGLVKMMAIGMGKRAGADSLHRAGFGKMGERLPLYAKVVFDNCNVIFGVAPIENEFDQTCRIEVIPAEEIFDREPELLRYAKSRLPRILLPETDVLIVGEIGKNFSGSGMDPNVTGTFGTPYATGGIQKQRVVVLDLSEQTHDNFIGLGMADTTTKRAFEKLDTNAAYFNMLTSTVLCVGKIPMVLEDDKLAIQAALKTLTQVDREHIRMVYLKNTLSLETIMVSEALLEQVRGRDDMEILEQPHPLSFDSEGRLLDLN